MSKPRCPMSGGFCNWACKPDEQCHLERIHSETDPKLASIQFDLQAMSSRDPWTKNKGRAERILKDREERREGLTDLRYGRKIPKHIEDATLAAPNYDGIQPKGVFG